MNGLRFKVGERARYVVPYSQELFHIVGEEVVVEFAGPVKPGGTYIFRGYEFDASTGFDYLISVSSDLGCCCMDFQLQKLDPPAEPESITRREEVEA